MIRSRGCLLCKNNLRAAVERMKFAQIFDVFFHFIFATRAFVQFSLAHQTLHLNLNHSASIDGHCVHIHLLPIIAFIGSRNKQCAAICVRRKNKTKKQQTNWFDSKMENVENKPRLSITIAS